MLVLTRKESQRIRIGDDIVITIAKIDGNKVRVGIDAPAEVSIVREEIIAHDDEIHAVDQNRLVTC